jgi:hypothetical protein
VDLPQDNLLALELTGELASTSEATVEVLTEGDMAVTEAAIDP